MKTINLTAFLLNFSKLIDQVHSVYHLQHVQVAYICLRLAEAIGLSEDAKMSLLYGALLRDLGVLSLRERHSLHQTDLPSQLQHSRFASVLLSRYAPFQSVAVLIENHHRSFQDTDSYSDEERLLINILFFSDILVRRITKSQTLRSVLPDMKDLIHSSPTFFHPAVTHAFLALSIQDAFWFSLEKIVVEPALLSLIPRLDGVALDEFAKLSETIQYFVDFRSEFTILHSSGVTAVAEKLAVLKGCSAEDCLKVRVAGHLHDLGKFATPAEVLEKPVQLSIDEFALVKAHPFFTHVALKDVKGLEVISEIAGYHHERLSGTGYPYGLSAKDLRIEARIMAVADVFAAITEERPYRDARSGEVAVQILEGKAAEGKLDAEIVGLVARHLKDLCDYKNEQLQPVQDLYHELMTNLIFS